MNEAAERPRPSKAPRAAIQLIIAILIALGLLAIYANVQRNRRDKLESVTISTPSPSPAQTR
ncbi:MAG: hypothetical protein ACJ8KU_01770 [Chthoniobacterales bacterium]